MAEEARPLWSYPGFNIYGWDSDNQTWRQLVRHDEKPCDEAVWLYRNPLLAEDDPAWYEWSEDGQRYRIERWSPEALALARREYPFFSW